MCCALFQDEAVVLSSSASIKMKFHVLCMSLILSWLVCALAKTTSVSSIHKSASSTSLAAVKQASSSSSTRSSSSSSTHKSSSSTTSTKSTAKSTSIKATSSSTKQSSSTAKTSTKKTTSSSTTHSSTTTKSSTTKSSSSSSSTAMSTGKVKYAGVNIAGFDFGCLQDGSCPVASCTDPGDEGAYQMQHFVKNDGLNAFRLPVAWQYLVNAKLGGTLDSTNFAKYDKLVSACLDVAELCIISIHNYGRWNGSIIGQSDGAVTNAHFSSIWSQLAKKYANEPKVAFGLMNEPHRLCIGDWAETVQEAVTAIRKAGATDNIILLPGTSYSSAGAFLYDGSSQELSTVVNLDGTITNLVFDVHIYLDSDGTGTHSECTTGNVAKFTTLAAWLRKEGRQAFLSETGGGNTTSCVKYMRLQLQTLMANSDVYLGWTGWAAGKFKTSYVLSETPFGEAGNYTDQLLVTEAIAGVFNSV